MRASEKENADLFWGLRGGGGNFGIVTEFEFRLHRVGPTVLAGPIFWPIEESPELLRFYRDWIADAPDELMTIVIHRKAPALPFVPPELHGELVAAVACCYAGPVEDGEAVVRPAAGVRLAGARPLPAQALRRAPVDVRSLLPPRLVVLRARLRRRRAHGRRDRHHRRARAADRVPARRLPDLAARRRGGARRRRRHGVQRPRRGPHLQPHRARRRPRTASSSEREWARTFWSALEPYHTGVYVNFLMDEGEERVRQAYGPEKYDRLQALKRRYDPDNLLRLNQNIPPA